VSKAAPLVSTLKTAATVPQDNSPASPAVLIPAPVRSPLRAPVQPARGEELKLTLPRLVTDRLEQLERRLEKLERNARPGTDPHPANPAKNP
jgi:hypothetical protein